VDGMKSETFFCQITTDGKESRTLGQRKRMNAKFLFFSGIRLFNKITSAVFRRIC